MLNLIWPVFLIISFVYGICFGDIAKTNMSIFESTESAVNLCIQLLGTICLWNGIMKIAQRTSIVEKLKKILHPLLRFLFPKINRNEEVYTEISMNIVANMMGLRKCSNTYGIKSYEIITEEKQGKK